MTREKEVMMPFFNKGKRREDSNGMDGETVYNNVSKGRPSTNGHNTSRSPTPKDDSCTVQRPKLVFHCQQAHGSPTGILSGFTNVKELYQKIAECYDIQADDVSECLMFHL